MDPNSRYHPSPGERATTHVSWPALPGPPALLHPFPSTCSSSLAVVRQWLGWSRLKPALWLIIAHGKRMGRAHRHSAILPAKNPQNRLLHFILSSATYTQQWPWQQHIFWCDWAMYPCSPTFGDYVKQKLTQSLSFPSTQTWLSTPVGSHFRKKTNGFNPLSFLLKIFLLLYFDL